MPSIGRSSVRGYYRPRLTVDQRLGLEWQVAPGTAHQRLYGHNALVKLMLDVVNIHRELDEHTRLSQYMAPLEAAWAHGSPTDLCNQIIVEAIDADKAEDMARDRFLLDRSHDNRRAWLKCIHPERATKLKLSHALDTPLGD